MWQRNFFSCYGQTLAMAADEEPTSIPQNHTSYWRVTIVSDQVCSHCKLTLLSLACSVSRSPKSPHSVQRVTIPKTKRLAKLLHKKISFNHGICQGPVIKEDMSCLRQLTCVYCFPLRALNDSILGIFSNTKERLGYMAIPSHVAKLATETNRSKFRAELSKEGRALQKSQRVTGL